MYDELYYLLKLFNDNKRYIDETFIINAFEIIKEGYKVEEFVNKIDINYNLNFGGTTVFKEKKMIINPLYKHNDEFKQLVPEVYHLMYNSSVLLGIFHEFMHIKQEQTIIDACKKTVIDDPLRVLLISLAMKRSSKNKHFKIRNSYYIRNHDNDPMERDANYSSVQEIIKIHDKMPQNDETKLFNDLFREFALLLQLVGYKLKDDKTNNPTLDYLRRMPFTANRLYVNANLSLLNNPNLDYETRLKYGLWLTSDEYLSLYNELEELKPILAKRMKP